MQYSQAIPFTRFFFPSWVPSISRHNKTHEKPSNKNIQTLRKPENITKHPEEKGFVPFGTSKKRRKYTKLCKSAAFGDGFFPPFHLNFLASFFQVSEPEAFEKAETQTVQKLSPSLRLRKHLRTHHSLFRYLYIFCRVFKELSDSSTFVRGWTHKVLEGGSMIYFGMDFFPYIFAAAGVTPVPKKTSKKRREHPGWMVLEWMILAMWTRLVRVDLVDVFFSRRFWTQIFFWLKEKNPWIFQRFSCLRLTGFFQRIIWGDDAKFIASATDAFRRQVTTSPKKDLKDPFGCFQK